jgi:inorganic pyrophosphatase
MTFEERKAQVKSYLGEKVFIGIDRPVGYVHKKDKYTLIYPINYGFVPGVLGGDGEELDVYLLGVTEPVAEYECEIIAIAHRHNDVEDKLVGAPVGMHFSKEEIEKAIHFQEQYYDTEVETL